MDQLQEVIGLALRVGDGEPAHPGLLSLPHGKPLFVEPRVYHRVVDAVQQPPGLAVREVHLGHYGGLMLLRVPEGIGQPVQRAVLVFVAEEAAEVLVPELLPERGQGDLARDQLQGEGARRLLDFEGEVRGWRVQAPADRGEGPS